MTTIRATLNAPGGDGESVSISIEMIVDEDTVEESGAQAASLVTRFMNAYTEQANRDA